MTKKGPGAPSGVKLYVNQTDTGVQMVAVYPSGVSAMLNVPLHLIEELAEGLIRIARNVEEKQMRENGTSGVGA